MLHHDPHCPKCKAAVARYPGAEKVATCHSRCPERRRSK